MISVKSIFIAGVVSLSIVLSSSDTGKATQQASGGCTELLKDYLQRTFKGIKIKSLSIGENCETILDECCYDDEIIRAAINAYMESHPECNCSSTSSLTIKSCSDSPRDCELLYKGTMGNSNKPHPPYRVGIRTKILEKVVYAEATQLGYKLKGLRVEFKKDNKGNPFFQVSGVVSASKGGKPFIIDALKKYTGVQNIQATNLLEQPAQR